MSSLELRINLILLQVQPVFKYLCSTYDWYQFLFLHTLVSTLLPKKHHSPSKYLRSPFIPSSSLWVSDGLGISCHSRFMREVIRSTSLVIECSFSHTFLQECVLSLSSLVQDLLKYSQGIHPDKAATKSYYASCRKNVMNLFLGLCMHGKRTQEYFGLEILIDCFYGVPEPLQNFTAPFLLKIVFWVAPMENHRIVMVR